MSKGNNNRHYQLSRAQKAYLKLKYRMDQIAAFGGLIVLSPVLTGVAVAIKLEDGLKAPVIFTQERIGENKRHFTIYKFRSMKLETPHDTPTHLMASDATSYITKVGAVIRKYSLDELPQIVNILKGDMAIVGPRPALWNQYDLIAERDRYGANALRPGLTGWAQVHGRDELSIPKKASLDGWYTRHVGPLTDAACIAKTIASVLHHEGVAEGGVTEHRKKHEKKSRILILTNHSYMLYRFRKELIEKLMQRYEVILGMPFVGHEDDFKAMGLRCIRTDIDRRGSNPLTDMKLIRRYDRILQAVRPDFVITYSIKPNIYAGLLCQKYHIPYAANVQGLGTAFEKKGLDQFVTVLYRKALKRARTVFFENRANAREFGRRHIVSRSRVTILNGAGINLEEYPYTPYPKNDRVHFLYCGRIMKEKGMDELFKAVRKLHQDGADFVLDIIGFYEDAYKEQVRKLEQTGIVKFHGFKDDPRPYYRKADCIVLPSYHEGMSNVLLEAAAMGRPVITTDIPGCRETVDPGQTGFLVPARDTQALYQIMEHFLELSRDSREQMGRAGRRKMEREFSKDAVVGETIRGLKL